VFIAQYWIFNSANIGCPKRKVIHRKTVARKLWMTTDVRLCKRLWTTETQTTVSFIRRQAGSQSPRQLKSEICFLQVCSFPCTEGSWRRRGWSRPCPYNAVCGFFQSLVSMMIFPSSGLPTTRDSVTPYARSPAVVQCWHSGTIIIPRGLQPVRPASTFQRNLTSSHL